MQQLHLDRHGWLVPGPAAGLLPSPNVDQRPPGTQVSLLVLHNISLPPGRFEGPCVADLFLNRLDYGAHPWLERLRGLRVSAHFFIRRDGRILQFASTEARAWHAGVSQFEGRERCNDYSIGIELEGADTVPYTDRQYQVLARLARVLRARYPLAHVRGHQHIAPGRKTDPGPAFHWARFGRESGFLRRALPPR
ncbi:1,6-anhydro-N-acetylmuramyl-L-alanine amidase AmpD [Bordetella sp. 2513F-2]